ncbi:unnamed protein product [Merluccius merluccius]
MMLGLMRTTPEPIKDPIREGSGRTDGLGGLGGLRVSQDHTKPTGPTKKPGTWCRVRGRVSARGSDTKNCGMCASFRTYLKCVFMQTCVMVGLLGHIWTGLDWTGEPPGSCRHFV